MGAGEEGGDSSEPEAASGSDEEGSAPRTEHRAPRPPWGEELAPESREVGGEEELSPENCADDLGSGSAAVSSHRGSPLGQDVSLISTHSRWCEGRTRKGRDEQALEVLARDHWTGCPHLPSLVL